MNSAGSSRAQARLGVFYALACYTAWGLVPAYFKLLADVPPALVLAHRIVWSVVLLIPLIFIKRMWRDVRSAWTNWKTLRALIASTTVVAINWFTFIWAVSQKRIVETALGYYINPLIVAGFGVVFLKERLRPVQVVSFLLAAAAVTLLAVAQGHWPLLSLILAVSFALYGLIRKTAHAGPLVGLFVETSILFPIALIVVIIPGLAGNKPVLPDYHPAMQIGLLGFLGVVTAVPLLWFANAAKRLRLVTLGLLQYIGPTITLLLALLAFGESMKPGQPIAFPMIWTALAIFSWDAWRANKSAAEARREEPAPADPTPLPE